SKVVILELDLNDKVRKAKLARESPEPKKKEASPKPEGASVKSTKTPKSKGTTKKAAKKTSKNTEKKQSEKAATSESQE
ncbi:MAG: hypothetical protein ACOCWQ_03310, partial [Nanoarchaeota archaeon]